MEDTIVRQYRAVYLPAIHHRKHLHFQTYQCQVNIFLPTLSSTLTSPTPLSSSTPSRILKPHLGDFSLGRHGDLQRTFRGLRGTRFCIDFGGGSFCSDLGGDRGRGGAAEAGWANVGMEQHERYF